jgi:CRP-like cAMP-binding protein
MTEESRGAMQHSAQGLLDVAMLTTRAARKGPDMTIEQTHRNLLLAAIPPAVLRRLERSFHRFELHVGDIVNEPGDRQGQTIFPENGVISVINTMQEGRAIEVATIGREGMSGVPALLGVDLVPYRYVVQVPGTALKMKAAALREAAKPDSPVWRMLLRYYIAFTSQIMQSVACAGLHSVEQRCCRWLLTTHDRVDSDQFSLTHEYLAIMLGTRRTSVSQILHKIRDRGLIEYRRGKITIVDRAGLESRSCECYQTVADIFRRVTDGIET